MPTYDAGSIRSTADLNRDPFIEGLRLCLQEGREFARQKFTATASVDTVRARRELAQLQLMMRRISEETVDIDVRVAGSTAARLELARLRAEQQRYKAEAAASKAEQSRWNAQLGESRVRLEEQRAATVRARQELNTSRSAWRDYERQVAAANRTTARATQQVKEQRKEFSLMRNAIEQLGPPLVPLAGGVLAAGSAFAGLGIAGVLAVKGITAEYKAGTPLGLQYAGMLRTLQGELATVSHTAAGGVLTGFEAGVRKTLVTLPAFNREVATSSRNLGDIANHLVGGFTGGFVTFSGLIHTVEGDVDRLAARFEAWATGPAGAAFADHLATDYGHLRDFLGEFWPLLTRTLSALEPVGTTMLDDLTALSHVINAIPVPILQAAATAYIAYRTALLITTPLTLAARALDTLRASQIATAASTTTLAESQAAAAGWGSTTLYRNGAQLGASRGFAGGLATATRAVLPYAAAWAGATIAIGAAANATAKWRHEADTAKSTFANTVHLAHDWLTFNFGNTGRDINDQRIANRNASAIDDAQSGIDRLGLNKPVGLPGFLTKPQQQPQFSGAGLAEVITRNAGAIAKARGEWTSGLAAMRALTAAGADQGAVFAALEARTQAAATAYHALRGQINDYRDGLKGQTDATRMANRQTSAVRDTYAVGQQALLAGVERTAYAQAPTLTAGAANLQKYSDVISSAIKNEQKWAETTDHNTVTIRGHHFALTAWTKALDQANGDTIKAAGLLLGHRKALNDDRVAADLAAAQQGRLTASIGAAERKYALNDQQLNLYASTLGITSKALATGQVSQQQFLAAIGRVKAVIDSADTATAGWVTALQAFTQGTDTAASRAQLLAAAMVSMNGTTLSYGVTMSAAAAANQQFVDAFDKADKSVVNAKRGLIDYRNAGAQPVLAALQGLQTAAAAAAAATYQDEVATKGKTRASKDAADVYWNDTHKALVQEHKQLGLTRGEAEKLAQRYFHWPKDAKTRLELMGTEGTNKLLNGIGEQLALLTGKPWISTLTADNRPAKGKISDLQAEINAIRQGKIPHLTVDNYEGRRKIEELQQDIANLKAQALVHVQVVYDKPHGNPKGTTFSTGAHGQMIRAYAGGGVENHWPTIAKTQPGTVRIWAEPETKGEAYIPLANDWRRPRARDIASETVALLGGVAFFAAGGNNPPGGFTHVTGPSTSTGSGSSGSGGAGGTTAGSAAARHTQSLLNQLKTLARQVAADVLGLKTFHELDKLSSSALESYAAGLLKQTQRAHDLKAAPSALVKQVKDESTQLRAELRVRERILADKQRVDAKVATARSNFNNEVSTVRQASMSPFDITQSGQGYAFGIKASLDRQLADAQRFQKDLAQARRMKLSPGLVRQFAEAGPASMQNLEAIIRSGQAYVTSIDKEYAQLSSVARATGVAEADQLGLGKALHTALENQAKVDTELRVEMKTVNHTLRQLRGDLHTLTGDIKDARRAAGGKR